MKKSIHLLVSIMLVLSGCNNTPPADKFPVASIEAPPQAVSQAVSQAAPESAPEPLADSGWKLDSPQNHNMDPDTFTLLHEELQGSTVYAMLTAKDGVIIDEYYRDGYDETSVVDLHSCSKSFTSALVGIALEQGRIKSIDDPLSDYLPEVLELEDTDKRQITLRHLLTHTSGLEWYEWGGDRSNWKEFRSAGNWVEYILGQKLVTKPGTSFNYGTGATHLLTAALEQAVGTDALEYGKANLFKKLGMDSVRWGADPQGIIDGGNGISMTVRDAARFGQLYLEGGMWNGEQLISADWLAQSTSVQNAGPGGSTGEYGLSWWVRPFGAGNYDTYYAFGAWGQYIFVVPELDLVTVIASSGPQDSYLPRPYFTDYVLAAYNG